MVSELIEAARRVGVDWTATTTVGELWRRVSAVGVPVPPWPAVAHAAEDCVVDWLR